MSTIQKFCVYIDDSLFLSLTSLGKKNLILYSIFDHLTFRGWDIFLFVKKSLEFNRNNMQLFFKNLNKNNI
jgi:hypothetical protein